MADWHDIADRLRVTPLLVVDCDRGTARLVTRAEAVTLVEQATTANLGYLMDLSRCLASYARIVGTADRTLTIDEVGSISGLGRDTVSYYAHEGVLTPSVRPSEGPGRGRVRLYSSRDGYIAGVVGSLRRQRVAMDILRRVAELLRQPADAPTVNIANDDRVEA